jgi:hypothetical protein
MSQLVKTKRQTNFKDFKRFGAFKGLVEQKNVLFNLFLLNKLLLRQKTFIGNMYVYLMSLQIFIEKSREP